MRRAFSMLELVFVIVIMGILGKFGVEFLMQAYQNYIFSTLQNRLQQQSEAAITQIAARLQYRIKGSIVTGSGNAILSWVGADIEGWRGFWNGTRFVPNWSGFIDLNTTAIPNPRFLSTPSTNAARTQNLINTLSGGTTSFIAPGGNPANGTAIIFTGATDPTASIWGPAVATQLGTLAHPIQANGNGAIAPTVGDFTGVDVFEFYQLAWSAYTVQLVGTDLTLFYNYQPWGGDTFNAGNSQLLMQNVTSFQYQTVGDLIKIQVCVNDQAIAGGYSVCKEKTIF